MAKELSVATYHQADIFLESVLPLFEKFPTFPTFQTTTNPLPNSDKTFWEGAIETYQMAMERLYEANRDDTDDDLFDAAQIELDTTNLIKKAIKKQEKKQRCLEQKAKLRPGMFCVWTRAKGVKDRAYILKLNVTRALIQDVKYIKWTVPMCNLEPSSTITFDTDMNNKPRVAQVGDYVKFDIDVKYDGIVENYGEVVKVKRKFIHVKSDNLRPGRIWNLNKYRFITFEDYQKKNEKRNKKILKMKRKCRQEKKEKEKKEREHLQQLLEQQLQKNKQLKQQEEQRQQQEQQEQKQKEQQEKQKQKEEEFQRKQLQQQVEAQKQKSRTLLDQTYNRLMMGV
jgi:hypothetical protein